MLRQYRVHNTQIPACNVLIYYNHLHIDIFLFGQVLMELDCFKPLRQLVCALFVPQCSVKGGVLQPCSSVCSVAQQQCARDLELFSLSWPFNCHLLPDSQDPMQCSMP